MAEFSSKIYKVSQADILFLLLRRHASWALITIGVLIAAFLITSIILGDVRYAILALMVVFLLAPMVLALLYFYYALAEDIVFNILPHSLEIRGDEVIIRLFELIPKEEKKDTEEKEDKENNSEEPEYRQISERAYTLTHLGRYEVGINSVVFPIKGSSQSKKLQGDISGYMFVPAAAFTTIDDFKQFVQMVANRL